MSASNFRALRDMLIFGAMGIIIEVVFTGLKSLMIGDWNATGQTYLWMFGVYAVAGTALAAVRNSVKISANQYANAVLLTFLVYVPMIYGFEFLSGWILLKVIGSVPWQYESGVTVMGLIRLDYAPFWFLLALLFEPIAEYMKKLNLFPEPAVNRSTTQRK